MFNDLAADDDPIEENESAEVEERPLMSDFASNDETFGPFEDVQNSCKCTRKCYSRFSTAVILMSRWDSAELNFYCKDHVSHKHLYMKGKKILFSLVHDHGRLQLRSVSYDCVGIMNALTRHGVGTLQKQHASNVRHVPFTEYHFQGVPVCQPFSEFVNSSSLKQIQNIRADFMLNGLQKHMHGSVHKSSIARALPLDVRKKAVTFIKTFSNNNALVLPGRMPTYRMNTDLLLLPSLMSKSYVYNKYVNACMEDGSKPVSQSLWYALWNCFCGNVVIQRPRTDLCDFCQKSVTTMRRLQGLPDEIKRQRITESLNHLNHVAQERQYYHDTIEKCKTSISAAVREACTLRPRKPNSFDGCAHYSFDYAQQVLLPHSSQQR
jgi:hypothetical protein